MLPILGILKLRSPLLFVLYIGLAAEVAVPQAAPKAPITQQGNNVKCGNVILLNGGAVNLTCTGLTKDQAKALQTTIPGMLESILHANDQQFAEIKDRLDGISLTAQTGNLRERTIALANAIMMDLYERGWMEGRVTLPPGERVYQHEPGPRDSRQAQEEWINHVTGYFRFKFAQPVIDIHEELAQVHLHDGNLDQFVDLYESLLDPRTHAFRNPKMSYPVNAWNIVEVADSLNKLASQMPNREQSPAK